MFLHFSNDEQMNFQINRADTGRDNGSRFQNHRYGKLVGHLVGRS